MGILVKSCYFLKRRVITGSRSSRTAKKAAEAAFFAE